MAGVGTDQMKQILDEAEAELLGTYVVIEKSFQLWKKYCSKMAYWYTP